MTNTMTNSTINTTHCTLNPNTFHDREAFQYILNSNFFDTQRSKPTEGFYVIDWNRFGVMDVEQEYAVYNFMRDEFEELVDLEDEDIHSKTIYFKVEENLLSVGVYDLTQNKVIAHCLWDIDEVDDLG